MGQIQNFQDLFSLRGLCPCCTPAPLPAALEGPRAWSPRPTLPRAGEEQAARRGGTGAWSPMEEGTTARLEPQEEGDGERPGWRRHKP